MSIRLSNPIRQLAKFNPLKSLSTTPTRQFGTSNVTNKHLRIWRPFDDSFFSAASKLMRNLEREFDLVSRQVANSRLFPFMDKSVENFNGLVVTDKDGNRKFQLVLELGDFQPEEIKIKTHGDNLNISAKKESQNNGQYYLREFYQSYTLPKELKLEDLKSRWTDDGCLIVEAPLPKELEGEKKTFKEIPIEHGAKKIEDKSK